MIPAPIETLNSLPNPTTAESIKTARGKFAMLTPGAVATCVAREPVVDRLRGRYHDGLIVVLSVVLVTQEPHEQDQHSQRYPEGRRGVEVDLGQ